MRLEEESPEIRGRGGRTDLVGPPSGAPEQLLGLQCYSGGEDRRRGKRNKKKEERRKTVKGDTRGEGEAERGKSRGAENREGQRRPSSSAPGSFRRRPILAAQKTGRKPPKKLSRVFFLFLLNGVNF